MQCRGEPHLVPPMAEAVVRFEHGRIVVGLEPGADQILGAEHSSEFGESRYGPHRALALDRLLEGRVSSEEVVIDERRRLVHHLVRSGGHAWILPPFKSTLDCIRRKAAVLSLRYRPPHLGACPAQLVVAASPALPGKMTPQ